MATIQGKARYIPSLSPTEESEEELPPHLCPQAARASPLNDKPQKFFGVVPSVDRKGRAYPSEVKACVIVNAFLLLGILDSRLETPIVDPFKQRKEIFRRSFFDTIALKFAKDKPCFVMPHIWKSIENVRVVLNSEKNRVGIYVRSLFHHLSVSEQRLDISKLSDKTLIAHVNPYFFNARAMQYDHDITILPLMQPLLLDFHDSTDAYVNRICSKSHIDTQYLCLEKTFDESSFLESSKEIELHGKNYHLLCLIGSSWIIVMEEVLKYYQLTVDGLKEQIDFDISAQKPQFYVYKEINT